MKTCLFLLISWSCRLVTQWRVESSLICWVNSFFAGTIERIILGGWRTVSVSSLSTNREMHTWIPKHAYMFACKIRQIIESIITQWYELIRQIRSIKLFHLIYYSCAEWHELRFAFRFSLTFFCLSLFCLSFFSHDTEKKSMTRKNKTPQKMAQKHKRWYKR